MASHKAGSLSAAKKLISRLRKSGKKVDSAYKSKRGGYVVYSYKR
jgi:hypothetical protein